MVRSLAAHTVVAPFYRVLLHQVFLLRLKLSIRRQYFKGELQPDVCRATEAAPTESLGLRGQKPLLPSMLDAINASNRLITGPSSVNKVHDT